MSLGTALPHFTQLERPVFATSALSALKAGKDCLVEKPLTTDPGHARELQQVARSLKRILMVGHVFRYNAGINYVRQLIGAGAIGIDVPLSRVGAIAVVEGLGERAGVQDLDAE